MNIKNVDCDHVASHLGKAQMLCTIVKNLLNKNKVASGHSSVYYLPTDVLLKHNISQQDLINFSERILRSKQNNLKDLSFELCTRANQHLESARSLAPKIPSQVRPILASSIECEVFLEKMQKYDFDLFDKNLNSDFRNKILFKLLIAKLKNKF